MSLTDVRRLWPEVLEEVKGRRRFTWILLSQNAHVAEVRNGTLVLAMPNAGARENFSRGGSEDILREALVVVLGADLKIETMIDPGGGGAGGGSTGSGAAGARPADPPARGQQQFGGSSSSGGSDPRPEAASPAPTAAGPPAGAAGPSADDDWPEPVRPPDRVSDQEAALDPASRVDANHFAHADAAPAAEPVPAEPVRSAAAAAARARLDELSTQGRRSEEPPPEPDPNGGADLRDSDLDESVESGTELLARHLGAQIIAEEDTRA